MHDAQEDFRMHHAHTLKHAIGVHAVGADVEGQGPEQFEGMVT